MSERLGMPYIVRSSLLPILACCAAVTAAGCMKTDHEAALERGAKALSAAEAQAAFSDHTMVGVIPQYNIEFAVYYAPSGVAVGKIAGAMQDKDRGQWRIAQDGKLCVRWGHWEDGEEACRTSWLDEGKYKTFLEQGRMASEATRHEGNAQKLELRSDLEIEQAKAASKPEDAQSLREVLVGNTASGLLKVGSTEVHVYYAEDGRAAVRVPAVKEDDSGSYRITDDGQLCVKWQRLQKGRESCGTWLREDKGFRVFDSLGTLSLVAKVRKGNPEKLLN